MNLWKTQPNIWKTRPNIWKTQVWQFGNPTQSNTKTHWRPQCHLPTKYVANKKERVQIQLLKSIICLSLHSTPKRCISQVRYARFTALTLKLDMKSTYLFQYFAGFKITFGKNTVYTSLLAEMLKMRTFYKKLPAFYDKGHKAILKKSRTS